MIYGRPTWLSCLAGTGQAPHAQSLNNCDAAAARMALLAQMIIQVRHCNYLSRIQTGLYALLRVSYSFAQPACGS